MSRLRPACVRGMLLEAETGRGAYHASSAANGEFRVAIVTMDAILPLGRQNTGGRHGEQQQTATHCGCNSRRASSRMVLDEDQHHDNSRGEAPRGRKARHSASYRDPTSNAISHPSGESDAAY